MVVRPKTWPRPWWRRWAVVAEVTTIHVGGEQPYDVLVGTGLSGHLPALVGGATRVAVLYAEPLRTLATQIADVLAAAGRIGVAVEIPDAEAGKSIDVAARCWDELASAGFTRTDAIVGVGGGAATDLAGFVAACWLRGVRVVHVPTSVLGMVDAAVGGKTGVNIAGGKNLVGAFHPPVGVLCDLTALDTLPPADLRAGLAEVIKCGFIADPVILELAADSDKATDPTSPVLRELIERAITVKARVVSEDLRESGLREILNYGHTLGHAIEKREGYAWRHGDAISVGMVFAAALGRLSGRLDRDVAARHRDLLTSFGLPVSYPKSAWPALRSTMSVDKKTRGSALRFVVLDGLARPGILEAPDEELLESAYAEVAGA